MSSTPKRYADESGIAVSYSTILKRNIARPALMRSDNSQPELKLSGFHFTDRYYIFFFARSAAS